LTLSYGNGSHAEIKGFKLTENITKVMAASTSAFDIAMATRNK
jgi:hypothetical protein